MQDDLILKFYGQGIDDEIDEMFANSLGEHFLYFLNKYLNLSKNKNIGVGEIGTTCVTFIVGDYIIKYITSSHSVYGPFYKTPRNYLMNKILDEVVMLDENNNFLGKLQVQPLLILPLKEDLKIILNLFVEELKSMGYFCDDLEPCDGKYNIYKLKDYRDADTLNYNELPDWFKENPYVLVDLDCVYPNILFDEVKEKHEKVEAFLKTLQKK